MLQQTKSEKMRMRITVGSMLFLGAVVSVMIGGFPFAVIFGTVCFLGCNEFIDMAKAKGFKPSVRIVRFMVFAFFALTALPVIPGLPFTWRFAIEHFPLLLTVGICMSFFRLLFRHEKPPSTIADIATTILGFIYVGFMPCHLVLLRNLYPPGAEIVANPLQQPGLAYTWATLFIIFGTDVFAYYAGKKFGKRLLYPEISPKKTVEGAIGGFVAGIFWCTVVFYLADNYLFPSHPFGFKLWQAPLMGAAVSIAAQLGDLCESLLKRDAGLKDSSAALPGHGGILDRGDSVIFSSAVAYYWVCMMILGVL